MLGVLPQLALALGLAAIGSLALRHGQGTIAGIAFAVAAVVVISLVRHGGLMAARRHYRAGRGAIAWRELSLVPCGGRLLGRQHRAYYRLLRAACRMDRGEWAAAIEDARAVLEMTGVPLANHATAHAAIGKCSLMLGDREAAARHLAKARSLPRKPRLDHLLAEIEDGLG